MNIQLFIGRIKNNHLNGEMQPIKQLQGNYINSNYLTKMVVYIIVLS